MCLGKNNTHSGQEGHHTPDAWTTRWRLCTYASCGWKGRLASEGAGFMKKELTVKDALDIDAKLTTQPYVPPVGAAGLVVGGDRRSRGAHLVSFSQFFRRR